MKFYHSYNFPFFLLPLHLAMSDQMFWNFASGLPAPGVFPKELLSVSTTELLDNQMNFNYGTYGAPQGVIESRNQIAEYLSNEFNGKYTKDS